MIKKIISGGQTGAHRAALDLAMELNITHGGWIPKGRLTEDGTLPEEYNLKEMPTDSYSASTEQNVMDSDGTLIISHGDLTGGSAYTCKMSKKHKKLWLHIDLDNVDGFQAGQILKSWIGMHEIQILNVAGSRASKDPVIYKAVQDILRAAITLEMITASVVKGSDLAPNLPRTVDEAVQRLLTELKLRDKAMIAKLDKEDLISLQSNIGEYVRNEFGIQAGNKQLINSCRLLIKKFDIDEDEASAVIIEKLWKMLNETHRLRVIK